MNENTVFKTQIDPFMASILCSDGWPSVFLFNANLNIVHILLSRMNSQSGDWNNSYIFCVIVNKLKMSLNKTAVAKGGFNWWLLSVHAAPLNKAAMCLVAILELKEVIFARCSKSIIQAAAISWPFQSDGR